MRRVLTELEAGETTTVARVPDWDPELLRYLTELALVPGASVEVVAHAPFGGPVTVRSGSGEHAIARELAGTIAVAPSAPSGNTRHHLRRPEAAPCGVLGLLRARLPTRRNRGRIT